MTQLLKEKLLKKKGDKNLWRPDTPDDTVWWMGVKEKT